MKQFALLFRMDITTRAAQPSKAEMKIYREHWNNWINDLSGNGHLAGGHHFSKKGVVLKGKNYSINLPYVAHGQSVAGYFLINAGNMKEALKIAKKCPILQGKKTSVEVRELAD